MFMSVDLRPIHAIWYVGPMRVFHVVSVCACLCVLYACIIIYKYVRLLACLYLCILVCMHYVGLYPMYEFVSAC